MILAFLAILIGLVVLVWSSDKFVDGAAAIAENAGISKLMVGLTIVALGTSAPEILVSAFAALEGEIELSVGNAIGSNVANIGLVLGFTALVVNVPVHKLSALQDLPIYLAVVALSGWVLFDNHIDLLDSLILLSVVFVLMFFIIIVRSKVKDPLMIAELTEEAEIHEHDAKSAWFNFVLGLVLLLLSSRLLVWGAVEVAQQLGVSELVIGLTIVAIGTSLPELAATLGSALKNHHDLAIGNVMGSNILNLLLVMGMPGFLNPGDLPEEVFNRDFLVMVLLSLLLTFFIFVPWKNPKLTRWNGITFLVVYGAYVIVLVQQAKV